MKRKPVSVVSSSPAKRSRPGSPPSPPKSTTGNPTSIAQWPAPSEQIDAAREIIHRAASASLHTLLVPDKDADGLSSAAIVRRTLLALGLPEEKIDVHFLAKGNTVHNAEEKSKMQSYGAKVVIVLDQGSRAVDASLDGAEVLVVDHHFVADGGSPRGCIFVTAANSPPVATSSLLTYHICAPLHPLVPDHCAWLCIVGTHGDLGNTLKWTPPFPDMSAVFKTHTKKLLNDVVSLVNAPRRTATFDVRSAWDALSTTSEPSTVLRNPRLIAARREVNAEVERCTHTAPKFSQDGKIAVFRINSAAQVHPVIATRWAGHLQSKALEIVLVANEGYLPGKVNFSCRVPRCARGREPPVDIIASLRAYASSTQSAEKDKITDSPDGDHRSLLERLGEDFARGHVQASGGIVAVDEFDELMRLMQIGVKPTKKVDNDSHSPAKTRKLGIDPSQKNTIVGYFSKPVETQKTAG